MATSKQVVKSMSDVKKLSEFLANPKKYVESQGLDPNDKAVAAEFEMYARSLVNNINAANSSNGAPQLKVADWGIGAGCCNSSIVASRN
jgi:hypothetical protein